MLEFGEGTNLHGGNGIGYMGIKQFVIGMPSIVLPYNTLKHFEKVNLSKNVCICFNFAQSKLSRISAIRCYWIGHAGSK